MVRTVSRADLPEIVSLLLRANETPYDIARVAEEKVFGRGVRGEPVVRVHEEDDRLIGISVTCGRVLRLIAVDPAYRRRGIGSQLLGGDVAFAEPGNYFTPGVLESDRATRAFLVKHGFIEERWTSNLETTQLPDSIPTEVQRVTEATRERVLAFVANHFGQAWRFECENAGDRLFFIEHEGDVAGFAAHDANNRGLGFFGPTGVAEAVRGRGFGTLLLHASLADLRAIGYRRVVIPWTEAIEFYGKACGAVVTGRFVVMTRGEMVEGRWEKGETAEILSPLSPLPSTLCDKLPPVKKPPKPPPKKRRQRFLPNAIGRSGGVALAAVAFWFFKKQADHVVTGRADRYDDVVMQAVHTIDNTPMHNVMEAITQLGTHAAIGTFAGLTAIAMLRKGRKQDAWTVVISTGGAMAINTILKNVFQRQRPIEMARRITLPNSHSFPSGHSLLSAATYPIVAHHLVQNASLPTQALVHTLAGLTIVSVGFSRVYFGVHFPSDVLGGFAAGFGWLGLTSLTHSTAERKAPVTG